MRTKAVPVGLEDFERIHFTEGFKWRYLEEMFWKSKKMYKIFNKYEFVREKLNIVEKRQFDKIWEMRDSKQSFKTSLLDLSNYLIMWKKWRLFLNRGLKMMNKRLYRLDKYLKILKKIFRWESLYNFM